MAITDLSENFGKRKPGSGMLLQILIATRGDVSLVKFDGENLGNEEAFMAMTPPVPVSAEVPGWGGVFSVSRCIL